jgi:pyruvate carboxylase subunit B
MSKKRVEFMNLAFRDGFQSVYGARVFSKDFMPAVEAAYKAGMRWFEAGGGARFQSCYFYCQEDAFDVMDEFRRVCPDADLQTLSRGVNVVGLDSQSSDMIKLHAELFKKHGISSIRNFDALNDVENLRWSGQCIHDAGLVHEVTVTLMGLPPGVDSRGAHTPEFYADRVKKILDAGIPFERLCFKDASGTTPPRVAYNTVKLARKLLGDKIHIQYHSHETAGNGLTCYLAALEAGADGVDVSMAPVSGGTCQPDIITLWHALRDSDFDLGIDIDKVRKAENVFKECMADYFLPPEALASNPVIIWSPMPGGALTANTQMMRDNDLMDKYDDMIHEMYDAVRLGGFGTSVTPVSQFYVQQAMNNVMFGKWKKIAPGYGKMVLGYFGRTPVEPDPEIVKIAAEQLGLEPTTKTVLEDTDADPKKSRAAAEQMLKDAHLPITDENVFIAACCQEKGIHFLKDPKNAPNGVRKGALARPKAAEASGGNEFTVSVNGTPYAVQLAGDAAAIVNGVRYAVNVQEGIQAAKAAPVVASAAATPAATGGEMVGSPVPGLVLRVSVADGATVARGDEVLVLEAMKMEIPVKAPCDGVVSLFAAAGDKVSTDDPLFSVGATFVSAPAPVAAAAEPVEEDDAPAAAAPAPVAGGEAVAAPVPGLVLRLNVANGATVATGDDVLVLEAMKMEIPVKAPSNGTVALSVAAGDKVATGDPLFSIV